MRTHKVFKRLGYTADREGLLERYFREKEAWQSHIEHTKQFILDEIPDTIGGICVLVGSGWWLDVPADELSRKFDKLIFVDISHPAQILKKAEQFPNIELISGDITGVLEPVYRYVRKNKKRSKPEFVNEIIRSARPLDTLNIPIADYYVSVNLLSQLTVFLRKYLFKKTSFTKEDVLLLEKQIQSAHIDLFPPEKSVYISDYREHCFDKKTGEETVRELIFADWPKGRQHKSWQWDFDLSGNYKQCKKTLLDVMALSRFSH